MSISIIVLAQHLKTLKSCMSSIQLYTEQPYELIVINDGAREDISLWIDSHRNVKSIASPEIIGVAAGYNKGAALAGGDRLVFMRDHAIVSEGWLSRLSACLEKHGESGMVGPLINGVSGAQLLPFPCNTMQQLDIAARAVALSRKGKSRKVPRLLSHLLLVRREAFHKTGGFDERFQLEAYEDDDLCYRMLQEGFSLYIAEDCFVRYISPPDLFPEQPGWYAERLRINREIAAAKWGFDLSDALFSWKHRVTVSLCMIVKNEEQTLGRCLSSVQGLVDEIIIVDTGSEDRTKEIAASFNARLYDFTWVQDFSAARNYAFSLATSEYILWLDADDQLLPRDAELFQALTASLPWDTDAVSMNYNLGFDDHGNVTSSLRRNRLVKAENGFRWIGPVHEYLEVSGNILASDIAVTHDRKHKESSRNLHIYESREGRGEIFGARDLYYFANELADHKLWERAVAKYESFLSLSEGWVEDKISACGRLGDCMRELGKTHEAREAVLRSFAYALPRAELCCRLGSYYFNDDLFHEAVFWYKLAAELEQPKDTAALLQHSCWTWLPHLQLCVCYDRLGQYELASKHNEIAAQYIPGDERVEGNREYFAKKNFVK